MHNCPGKCRCVFTEHETNRPMFANVYNVHLQYQTCIDMVTIMTRLDIPPIVRAASPLEILPHKP